MPVSIAHCLYYVIAAVLSVYQGARGFAFQYLRRYDELGQYTKTRWRRIWLLAGADAILHGVSCAAGFFALDLLARMWRFIDPADITVGTGAVMIFLLLFGLCGVTGQLPHLIQSGKLSPKL